MSRFKLRNKLQRIFYIFKRKELFYWIYYQPFKSKVERIWEKNNSRAKILYGRLMGYFTSRINILSEEDFSRYVSTSNCTIVRPKDPDVEITTYFDYPDAKYDYPVLFDGNLHIRKDNRFYLNFTNKRYTGVICSHDEGEVQDYFLDGSFVFSTHYRDFEEGLTLYERGVTRNGNFFQEYHHSGTGIEADPKKGIKEVAFIPDQSSKRHILSPNDWYHGDSTKKKYYKNGVLKQEIVDESIDFLTLEKSYSEVFYYPEGPKKERHTYNKEEKLVSKTCFNRCYIDYRDR